MELEKWMVKERVTLISNPRSNAKLWKNATMVRKSLIRFDKQVLIQELKERDTLTHTQKVYFYQNSTYLIS